MRQLEMRYKAVLTHEKSMMPAHAIKFCIKFQCYIVKLNVWAMAWKFLATQILVAEHIFYLSMQGEVKQNHLD